MLLKYSIWMSRYQMYTKMIFGAYPTLILN